VGLVRIQQKSVGRRYAELVFLHPVGTAGHVVHSGASEELNVDARTDTDSTKSTSRHVMPNSFFAFGGICGSRSKFRCIQGTKRERPIFQAWVGPVQIQQKVCYDKLGQTCVFASGGIRWSRSAFHCVRGAKHQHTIFHARVGPVRIPQKTYRDMSC
jgi:hypothetical protein